MGHTQGPSSGGGTADELPRSVTRPRILVVDDEEAIRSAPGRALAAEGLVIDLAGTAADVCVRRPRGGLPACAETALGHVPHARYKDY